MISICEKYASSHSITFNPNKSKLLCYNAALTSNVPQVYLNGEKIPVVDSNKHLGNFISTNFADRNITENVCDLYKRSNWIISDFRVCETQSRSNAHTIVELCAIRDGIANCDIMSCTEASKLIDLITLG